MAIQISSNQIKSANIITSLLAAEAVTAAKVSKTGTWDFSGATVRVAAPSADSDAVTKTYVDSLVSGLHWKDSARVKTTGAISGTYNNGSSGVGATLTNGSNGAISIDGVALVANDRVLVSDQGASDKEQNGIYFVSTVGDAGNPFVLTRALDANSVAGLKDAALFVREGSVNSDSAWVQTDDSISAIGTSDISFTQFSGTGMVTAGNGLSKSGNTLAVDLDAAAGLEFNSGALRVKLDGSSLNRDGNGIAIAANGVGTVQISDAAINSAKIAANAVGTSQLASNSVTSAKISDGAISTSAKLSDNVVITAKIADANITTAKLAANCVTAVKLNSDCAGAGLGLNGGNNSLEVIADQTTMTLSGDAIAIKAAGVDTAQLKDNSVNSGKIASNAVTSAKIASNAVTSAKVADGAISTSAKLSDGIVTTAKLANNAVDMAKLAIDPKSEKFSGNGSATAFELSVAVPAALFDSAAVYRNGLRMDKVASSPSGQDEYTFDSSGSGGVGRVTFGSAPDSADKITVDFWA